MLPALNHEPRGMNHAPFNLNNRLRMDLRIIQEFRFPPLHPIPTPTHGERYGGLWCTDPTDSETHIMTRAGAAATRSASINSQVGKLLRAVQECSGWNCWIWNAPCGVVSGCKRITPDESTMHRCDRHGCCIELKRRIGVMLTETPKGDATERALTANERRNVM